MGLIISRAMVPTGYDPVRLGKKTFCPADNEMRMVRRAKRDLLGDILKSLCLDSGVLDGRVDSAIDLWDTEALYLQADAGQRRIHPQLERPKSLPGKTTQMLSRTCNVNTNSQSPRSGPLIRSLSHSILPGSIKKFNGRWCLGLVAAALALQWHSTACVLQQVESASFRRRHCAAQ